jgi:hypothetical protein
VLADLQAAVEQSEFYQQVAKGLIRGIYSKETINRLGNRLVALAHHAYTLRNIDVVEQTSQMLMSLPLSHNYRSIGSYYHSFYLRHNGQIAEARTLLERLADKVPHCYRGRVIMSLAGLVFDNGDYESALPLYVEAGHAAHEKNWCDWFTALTTQRMVAVLNSINGNQHRALADLEKLLPVAYAARTSYPHEFYNYLNSLAIELGESGRLKEARNVCKIVLASPYLSLYKEWRETGDEIALRGYRASRSLVVVNRRLPKLENVVSMPIREQSESISSEKPVRPFFHQQAGVTFIREWKANMVKKRNGDKKDDKPKEELDDREMLLKIVQISTQKGLPDQALLEMVDALEKVAAKYSKKDDKND